MSIAQSIISQALPALSPRINLSFSSKTSDRTRLVESQSYPHNLEMNKMEDEPEQITTQAENQETELQTPKSEPKADSNKVQNVVTPNKWPLKPGVLVHVNSNHTLSPKNQARLHSQSTTEESNLGLLERSKVEEKSPPKIEYSKKSGKPKQNVVSGILKNIRRKSDDSDDDSGKYKKINKTNKRAMSLVNMNKTAYVVQKNRLKSLFQSEKPNIIVTEGGISHLKIICSDVLMGDTIFHLKKFKSVFFSVFLYILFYFALLYHTLSLLHHAYINFNQHFDFFASAPRLQKLNSFKIEFVDLKFFL